MINFRNLAGNNICNIKKRANAFGIVDNNPNPAYLRSKIVKKAVKKYKYTPQELRTLDEVKDYIKSELEKIGSVNKESLLLQINEAQRLAERYISADSKICVKPASKVVKFDGEKIEVRPDFLYEYTADIQINAVKKEKMTVVEVVSLSSGRTKMGSSSYYSRSKENDCFQSLVSMSLLMYGINVLGKRKGCVKVTFDSLKTSEDSNGDFSNPWKIAPSLGSSKSDNSVSYSFFFKNKKLMKIGSEYRKHPDIFSKFKKNFDNFRQGTDGCSKTLCNDCSFNELCSYVHPPIAKNMEHLETKVSDFSISDEQEAVINFDSGLCRVNAGAGVGKTFVIVQRIIKLLMKGTKPEDILVTTFTNAGIDELKARIKKFIDIYELPIDADKITVASFNSLGNTLIEKNYKMLGFTKVPTLIDDIELYDIVVELIKNKPAIDGLDYRNLFMNMGKNLVGAVPYIANEFRFIRDNFIRNENDYLSTKGKQEQETAKKVYDLYTEFEELMRENNSIDYSDQSNLVVKLLEMDDCIITTNYAFSHIIVDEFQDSNDFQMLFISELISSIKFKSLMVVGDDSQSIFGFRGTSPKNIIDFENQIGCSVDDFYLNTSFRSSGSIVEAANDVISLNTNRVNKTMNSIKGAGDKPLLKGFKKEKDELKYIANQIENLINDGESLEDIAFISFKNTTLNSLNKLLAEKGILGLSQNVAMLNNSRVHAAISLAEFFYDNESTKSLLVYLNDLYNNCFMSMNPGDVHKILNVNVQDYINNCISLNLKEKKDIFIKLLTVLDDGTDPIYTSFLEKVTSKSDYSIIELVDYILKFKLYNSKTTAKRQGKYDAISLTTAHSSKGLEWKHVFLSLSDFDSHGLSLDSNDIEERRRLIFVGVTRAKDNLTVTSVRDYETSTGSVSSNRFFNELKSLKSFNVA